VVATQRGLKRVGSFLSDTILASLPARAAWIETGGTFVAQVEKMCRCPRGQRGLKPRWGVLMDRAG